MLFDITFVIQEETILQITKWFPPEWQVWIQLLLKVISLRNISY